MRAPLMLLLHRCHLRTGERVNESDRHLHVLTMHHPLSVPHVGQGGLHAGGLVR